MLLRLLRQSAPEIRAERIARPKRRPQVYLMIAEQTGPEPAIRGEPNPVARSAIGMGHRRNDSHRTRRPGKLVIGSRPVALGGSLGGRQRAERRNAGQDLVAGNDMFPRQLAEPAERVA